MLKGWVFQPMFGRVGDRGVRLGRNFEHSKSFPNGSAKALTPTLQAGGNRDLGMKKGAAFGRALEGENGSGVGETTGHDDFAGADGFDDLEFAEEADGGVELVAIA